MWVGYQLCESHTNYMSHIPNMWVTYQLFQSHTNYVSHVPTMSRVPTMRVTYQLCESHINDVSQIQTMWVTYQRQSSKQLNCNRISLQKFVFFLRFKQPPQPLPPPPTEFFTFITITRHSTHFWCFFPFHQYDSVTGSRTKYKTRNVHITYHWDTSVQSSSYWKSNNYYIFLVCVCSL